MTRFRLKMIPIKPSPSCRREAAGEYYHLFGWTRSPAFAVNPRGILVHRVKHVSTILVGKEEHHYHVDYLCNNGCNVNLGAIDEVLVADPPTSKLLCQFCEHQAARRELPSADTLAGRHVHRGVLIAKQVCCGGTS